MPAQDNKVYLTFDDGPHPTITPWVLEQLKKYHAKATFFCIGKNVVQNINVYEQIINEGHAIGNHTYNHLNGWKQKEEVYIEDINKAAAIIQSNLFRPPYGRIRSSIAKKIAGNYKIIMWDVLSADFDEAVTPQQCLLNVLQNVTAGSIIVFHDSEKAFKNLEYVLPRVLEELDGNYRFESLQELL